LKIAIITDTHFGARNDNLNFNEYFYKFYEEQFFPYLKENNITHCIHMGDIMDRRKFISYRTAKDVRERFIKPFVDLGVELHVMVGNHDTYFKNTNEVNSVTELVGDRYKMYTFIQKQQKLLLTTYLFCLYLGLMHQIMHRLYRLWINQKHLLLWVTLKFKVLK